MALKIIRLAKTISNTSLRIWFDGLMASFFGPIGSRLRMYMASTMAAGTMKKIEPIWMKKNDASAIRLNMIIAARKKEVFIISLV
jgi:hypothetical protein